MSWLQKAAVALAMAFHGKQALATVGTVAAAGVTASQLGRDPVPWLIGAAAVTVVYAYKRPLSREHALANAVISIFLGGIGAPWAAAVLSVYTGPVIANDWILAGVLSSGWPWLVPLAMGIVRSRAKAMEAGNGQ
jgi:hypothetical protein